MPKVVNIENSSSTEITAEKKSKAIISIKQAHSIALGYISEIKRAEKYNEDNLVARDALAELVETILSQEKQSGSPDDYHNFSVALGRVDDNLACEIISLGRARFPMNVDLLADYLIYGMDCDRLDECKNCFDTLNNIPQNDWTWRCFQFEIAYMYRLLDLTQSSEERSLLKKNISQVARSYKKHLPFEEGGYREYAKTYASNREKELKELNEVLSSDSIACPSCAFRTADLLFNQKQYRAALEAINRSLEDAINQKQGGIDEYQLHFMAALCKIAIHLNEHIAFIKDEVFEIYSDFDISLKGLGSEYRETVKTRAHFLEGKTGIHIPDHFEELKDLIGY